MNKLLLSILVSGVVLFTINPVCADESKTKKTTIETTVSDLHTVTKDNYIKAKFASADNKFIQSNVKASYDDFEELIEKVGHDDYVILSYAIKLAEYGFFDLTENLIKKLDNNNFTKTYINDIKKYYYPTSLVDKKDLLYLSDAYSNIIYNNMAIETTSELLNNRRANHSDYKNYLIALGYYKSNNLEEALKHVDYAIITNDSNINYLSLKAQILADKNKPKSALKILEEIKSSNICTIALQKKIQATEEYVLYKTSKSSTLKDYHLAYYYHLRDKSLLATKVLQASIIQAKQHSSEIFSLLGKIYYENNDQRRAKEFSERAYRENSNNYLASLILANLSFDSKEYEKALKYYKKAKQIENIAEPNLGIAKTLLALGEAQKSKKLYEKLLKKYSTNVDVLTSSLKLFPQKADYVLPKVASMDILNNDIWLGLAKIAIRENNYSMANTYLNNSYYIDTNNFKYYYYLSLVLKAKGDNESANKSLIKCSRLNSNFATKLKVEQLIDEE